MEEKLEEIGTEITLLEHSLTVLVDAAWLDGHLSEEEKAGIADVEGAIKQAKNRRDEVARQIAEAKAAQAATREAVEEAAHETGEMLEDTADAIDDAFTSLTGSRAEPVEDLIERGEDLLESVAEAAESVAEGVKDAAASWGEEAAPEPGEEDWKARLPEFLVYNDRVAQLEAAKDPAAARLAADRDAIATLVEKDEYSAAIALLDPALKRIKPVWAAHERELAEMAELREALSPWVEIGKAMGSPMVEKLGKLLTIGDPDMSDPREATKFLDDAETEDIETVDASTYTDADFWDWNDERFVVAFNNAIADWAFEEGMGAIANVHSKLDAAEDKTIKTGDIVSIASLVGPGPGEVEKVVNFISKAVKIADGTSTTIALAKLNKDLTRSFNDAKNDLRDKKRPVKGYTEFATKFGLAFPQYSREEGYKLHKEKFLDACGAFARRNLPDMTKIEKAYAKVLFKMFTKDADKYVDGIEDSRSGMEAGYVYATLVWRPILGRFDIRKITVNDVDRRVVTAFVTSIDAKLITDLPIPIAVEITEYANDIADIGNIVKGPMRFWEEMLDVDMGHETVTMLVRTDKSPGSTAFSLKKGMSYHLDAFKEQKMADKMTIGHLNV